ncbi:phosphoribosylanthranilate isomerase [Bosea sp. CS1GBMeth4]|uniref:phosphoribosylanthranilate isomerase n=1 Tax=Bosea sp. CS1GBMeth4 TaxID=1892849 RepID=UPI001FCE3465|nr:phosphoribosylanthranilate isomerase [Bosea sp. CS1GBMeth4]
MPYCQPMPHRDDTFAIKICGLSTPETLEAALAAGAEMIGLNFHPRSPRYVTPQRAAELAAPARGRTQIVALIVDYAPEQAAELARILRPDWLQLHGSEGPEQVAAIRRATGLPVMKALGIATAADLEQVAQHRSVADRLLLDAKPPKDAAYPGGHGRPFDWSLLAGLDPAFRFMLSGGLVPANVAEAVRITRPAGVDVSSGVESAPGVKDAGRIADFVKAARAAAAELKKAGQA